MSAFFKLQPLSSPPCCTSVRSRTNELGDFALGFLPQLQQPIAHRPRRPRRLRLRSHRTAAALHSSQGGCCKTTCLLLGQRRLMEAA